MDFVDVVALNLAYIALVTAAFTRTLARLRKLLIAGAVFFITFGLIEQIWSIVVWNVIIGGIHTARLVRDILGARAVHLTPEEALIRDQLFPGSSDFDFNMLWALGREVTYSDVTIIERSTLPQTVALVLEGVAHIRRDGETLRHLRRGALLGEMSFVTGEAAAVDVLANGDMVVHQWEQRQLSALGQTNPASARALERLISQDLAAKAHI